MLDTKKLENLESIVLKGLCLDCQSLDVCYSDNEKSKKFWFYCQHCGWKTLCTYEDFKEVLVIWTKLL
jgi:ribosomal protein S27E